MVLNNANLGIQLPLAVLIRDGTNVVTEANCASASGSWFCKFPHLLFRCQLVIDLLSQPHTAVYDGKTWTAASDIDIVSSFTDTRPMVLKYSILNYLNLGPHGAG